MNFKKWFDGLRSCNEVEEGIARSERSIREDDASNAGVVSHVADINSKGALELKLAHAEYKIARLELLLARVKHAWFVAQDERKTVSREAFRIAVNDLYRRACVGTAYELLSEGTAASGSVASLKKDVDDAKDRLFFLAFSEIPASADEIETKFSDFVRENSDYLDEAATDPRPEGINK
jgi:hypothetical protein